jgi:hypothetical protein
LKEVEADMTQLSILKLNFSAIFFAAVASFLFGGIWYGLLARRWIGLAADGGTATSGGLTPLPFVITFIAQLVMVVMLSGVLSHVTGSGVPFTLRSALISALLIWTGFVVTTLAATNALHGAPFARTLVDSGHWLGVLLIQSTVLFLMSA